MPEASAVAQADETKPSTSTNPPTTSTAPSTDDANTRGRPYYEKLRQDLKNTIEEKRKLDKQMAVIETNISRLESSYLDETAVAGNIIKGFDNYVKASTSAGTAGAGAGSSSLGTGTSTRRKGGVSDQDRIFSRSSVAWMMRDSPIPLLSTHSGLGGLSPAIGGVSGTGGGTAAMTNALAAAAAGGGLRTGTTTTSGGAPHSGSATPSSVGGGGLKGVKKKNKGAGGVGTPKEKKEKDKDKDKDKEKAKAEAADGADGDEVWVDAGGEERPSKRGKVSWGRD